MSKENDIKIDITGGDWREREMLADLVSGQLQDRGFNNVEAVNASGNLVHKDLIGYRSPRTILDAVKNSRPDLFDRKITVSPAPRESLYPSNEKGFPGVTTMVRNEEGSTITDLLMYDNPAKMIERARSLGSEVTHVGIRANTFTAATDAVRNAVVAAPNAFVTVSISDEMYPHPAQHPARIYFNDPPEKVIDLNDIDVRAPGQRAIEEACRQRESHWLPKAEEQLDLTTDDYGNPLNNDPIHNQIVSMVKNNLINSGGFSELANDIAQDVARDAGIHAPQNAADHLADAKQSIAAVEKIEHLGEKKYIPPVDRSKKRK